MNKLQLKYANFIKLVLPNDTFYVRKPPIYLILLNTCQLWPVNTHFLLKFWKINESDHHKWPPSKCQILDFGHIWPKISFEIVRQKDNYLVRMLLWSINILFLTKSLKVSVVDRRIISSKNHSERILGIMAAILEVIHDETRMRRQVAYMLDTKQSK